MRVISGKLGHSESGQNPPFRGRRNLKTGVNKFHEHQQHTIGPETGLELSRLHVPIAQEVFGHIEVELSVFWTSRRQNVRESFVRTGQLTPCLGLAAVPTFCPHFAHNYPDCH